MRSLSYHFAIALLFASISAQAAKSNTVRGLYGSTQAAFEVVVEADGGLKPGLYSLGGSKKNDATPVVLGSVLGVSRSYDGILDQFALSNHTRRNEALAVVNNRLVLFSGVSSSKDSKSVVTFGDGQKVYDALTNRPVALEPIKSIDDINVFISTHHVVRGKGQIAFVSVRQPNAMGDGITFAFAVKDPQKSTSEITLVGQPLVIDYAFYTSQELQRLEYEPDAYSELKIISPVNLLSRTIGGEGEPKALRQWRQQIARYVRTLVPKKTKAAPAENSSKEKLPIQQVPALDLWTRTESMASFPADLITKVPFEVSQRIDPLQNRSGLIFASPSDASDVDTQIKVPGLAAYDEKQERYRFLAYSGTGDEDSSRKDCLITIINGRPVILFKTENDSEVAVPIEDDQMGEGVNFSKFSLVHEIVQNKNTGLINHYFIVSSSVSAPERSTRVYTVEELAGTVRLSSYWVIDRKFYSQKDLKARTRTYEQYGKQVILFDNTTELSDGGTYNPEVKRTTPFLNITDSSNRSRKQIYLQTLAEIGFTPELKFREFNPKGAEQNLSGFYLEHPQEGAPPIQIAFEPGKLLRTATDGNVQFDDRIYMTPIKDTPEVRIGVVPYSPTQGKAAVNRLSFLLFADSISSDRSDNLPIHATVEVDADFSRLQFVKVISGRRKRSKEVSILAFFGQTKKKSAAGVREASGVFTASFELELDMSAGKGKYKLIPKEPGFWLTKDPTPGAEIKRRAVYDSQGGVFWLENPEETRLRYQSARRLTEPRQRIFYQQSDQKVSLRLDESIIEEKNGVGGLGVNFSYGSRWVTYSATDLEQRYPNWYPKLKARMEEEEKKHFSSDDEKSKATDEDYFPAFNSYLDLMASSVSPKSHEILLVEPELKPYFMELIARRSFRGFKSANKTGWDIKNNDFWLYIVDPASTKKEMISELENIGSNTKGRSVVMSELSDLIGPAELVDDTDSPETSKSDEEPSGEAKSDSMPKDPKPMSLSPKSAEAEANSDDDESDDDEESEPTLRSRLALMATEGQDVSLKRFKEILSRPVSIPMLIIATPDEWRLAQKQHEAEAAAGLFSRFHINYQFLTASWSVWSPTSKKASKEIKAVRQAPISPEEHKVFPNLESILNEAASRDKAPKHRIVIVPDELRVLVNRLVMGRWATDAPSMRGPWSHSNADFALFNLDRQQTPDQSSILDNFDAMKGAASLKRVAMVGDLNDIGRIGRPAIKEGASGYQISDPLAGAGSDTVLSLDASQDATSVGKLTPHIMWNIATEGQMIAPSRSKNWKLDPNAPKDVSVLLFGSERDLAEIRRDMAFESRYMDIDEHFETIRLEVPAVELKESLIMNLLDRSEIAAIGYSYVDDDGKITPEAKAKLVRRFVSRVEQLARPLNQEGVAAFIRAFTELRRSLTEDSELRRKRTIDFTYLERLFARVFPMPLSINVLEPNDPLRKMQDPDAAAIALDKAGYKGSLEMKTRIISTIKSQTGGSDGGRPIPSSTILFGGTSTGKTFLFMTLVKWLGLKLYDFDRPMEEDASAMVIHVGAIVPDAEGKQDPSKLTVSRVIEHIQNFLALPNGSRGYILFDDMHKGASDVLPKLMAYIQSIFEAPGRMIRVKKLPVQGVVQEVREIPITNLNLFMTVNPTMDKGMKERFIDKNDPRLISHIVAALARDNVPLEESFFARWSDIINADQFPREAKVPALVEQVRATAQQGYIASPRLVLASPEVLDLLVTSFPKSNAREFLSAAASALLTVPSDLPEAPIYVVYPKSDKASVDQMELESDDKEGFGSRRISKFVRENTIIKPISLKNIASLLDLTSFMLQGFRVQLYHAIAQGSQSNPITAGSFDSRKNWLGPLLMGVMTNMSEKRYIPIHEVEMHLDDFGRITASQEDQIEDAIEASRVNNPEPYFPMDIPRVKESELTSLAQFLGSEPEVQANPDRVHAMSVMTGELRKTIMDAFRGYFRLHAHTIDPQSWIKSLQEGDPAAIFEKTGVDISSMFLRFSREIHGDALQESKTPGLFGQMTTYDEARLFMYCVDKAITQLDWGEVSKLMYDVLDVIGKDSSLGQAIPFQHFVFKSALSPLATVTTESMYQSAQGTSVIRETPKGEIVRRQERFQKECSSFLARGRSKGEKP